MVPALSKSHSIMPFCVVPSITSLVTVSMLNKSALLSVSSSPVVVKLSTLAVTVSVVSRSVRLNWPLSVSPASVSVRLLTAVSPAFTVISGASLVPLMVMVSNALSLPP